MLDEVTARWQSDGADAHALLYVYREFAWGTQCIEDYGAYDNLGSGATEVFLENLNLPKSFEGTGKGGKNTESKASSLG